MMHAKKNKNHCIGFAGSVGVATASAWILSDASAPFAHIETGLRIIGSLTGESPSPDMVLEFLSGGQNLIGIAALELGDKLELQGQAVPDSLAGSLTEMRAQIGEIYHDLKVWMGSSVTRVQAQFFKAPEAAGPDGPSVFDAGKGLVEALHGAVKAWVVFSAAKRAFRWAMDRVSTHQGRPPEEAPEKPKSNSNIISLAAWMSGAVWKERPSGPSEIIPFDSGQAQRPTEVVSGAHPEEVAPQ